MREVVASDGATVASRVSYDPWGKSTESGSGALTDFAFTGHHLDRPTGLALAWYRGYEPNLGRWLSQDPIGLRGGLNLYGYVNNDPANFVDPWGLQAGGGGSGGGGFTDDFCPNDWDGCKRGCKGTCDMEIRSCNRRYKEGAKERSLCYQAAMDVYSGCLADCDKNHPK